MSDALSAALAEGRARLRDRPGATREARMLLAHAARLGRDEFHRLEPGDLSEPVLRRYAEMVARRAGGEPVSRILGYRDFWRGRFRISPDVLDPRPDTETLVAAALERPYEKVLDLGTGSGCILVSLLQERPGAIGIGTDVSAEALAVARKNADALGVGDRARFVLADWFDGVEGIFDLVVSNPPYIAEAELAGLSVEVGAHDPRGALSPGPDGLAAYRAILAGLACHLAPGGRLIAEVGWRQGRTVRDLFGAGGLEALEIRHDLDGRDRIVCGMTPKQGA